MANNVQLICRMLSRLATTDRPSWKYLICDVIIEFSSITKEMVDILINIINDPDVNIRSSAAMTFSIIIKRDIRHVNILKKLITIGDKEVVSSLTITLQELILGGYNVKTFMEQLANHDEQVVRYFVAKVLKDVSWTNPELVYLDLALYLAQDDSAVVRFTAIKALREIVSPENISLIEPTLIDLTYDRENGIRTIAQEILQNVVQGKFPCLEENDDIEFELILENVKR